VLQRVALFAECCIVLQCVAVHLCFHFQNLALVGETLGAL